VDRILEKVSRRIWTTTLGSTVVDSVGREAGIDTLFVSRSQPTGCQARGLQLTGKDAAHGQVATRPNVLAS
jgi:hypothetical protein